jgi:Domain of unknown function (DUF5655)
MSTDFNQKERDFVAQLRAQSGRDLSEWMAAIAASGFAHRNDIIDWLRQSGFSFAHASWLERIHHNSGRLIYEASTDPVARRKAKPTPNVMNSTVPKPTGAHPPDADLDQVLASAKAYRPLAQVLLRDILAAVPGADATPAGDLILVSHSQTFAAVMPSPKDVRLYLALGTKTFDEHWGKARITGAHAAKLALLTHMMVLSDARQLTLDLALMIKASAQACARSNH